MVEKVSGKVNLKDGFFIDGDKATGAVVRFMNKGDVFCKFGGGSKKLVDFFTDKKIPLRLREEVPLIAKDSDVLFIANIGISEHVKVEKDCKNILKLTYLKN